MVGFKYEYLNDNIDGTVHEYSVETSLANQYTFNRKRKWKCNTNMC